ncbi:hypothetical protein, partial [Ruegeria arenilitoris]|uniref:hypothetical protein n=1 Tax=Ruegeria arenilitoris TaxID=1173585 RepID=UPI001C2BC3A8
VRSFAEMPRATAMRTKPPDAGAAKIKSIARQCHGITRDSAARFLDTGRSNHAYRPKLNQAVRFARI